MLVIDVYGKIQKTNVSNKLKLYIDNIPDDWKKEIKIEMLQEIRQQKVDIEDNIRRYGVSYQEEYTISYLSNIVRKIIVDYASYELDSIDSCISCLIDNMVYLFFDYENNDMPFFDWTNNIFDERFCEEDYAEKIIYFSNFVNRDIGNGIIINCIYSSNEDINTNTNILFNLSHMGHSKTKNYEMRDNYISGIINMGVRIDNILNFKNDYYKLDYVINGIYKDNNYNQNHYLKVFTLLELSLLDLNQKTSDIDELLVPYLENIYGSNTLAVAKRLRQMRNKIGHGDFDGFNRKAESFAKDFMKHYSFDYTEHSRLNWILLYTCCLLDDLLRSVLFHQLKL